MKKILLMIIVLIVVALVAVFALKSGPKKEASFVAAAQAYND